MDTKLLAMKINDSLHETCWMATLLYRDYLTEIKLTGQTRPHKFAWLNLLQVLLPGPRIPTSLEGFGLDWIAFLECLLMGLTMGTCVATFRFLWAVANQPAPPRRVSIKLRKQTPGIRVRHTKIEKPECEQQQPDNATILDQPEGNQLSVIGGEDAKLVKVDANSNLIAGQSQAQGQRAGGRGGRGRGRKGQTQASGSKGKGKGKSKKKRVPPPPTTTTPASITPDPLSTSPPEPVMPKVPKKRKLKGTGGAGDTTIIFVNTKPTPFYHPLQLLAIILTALKLPKLMDYLRLWFGLQKQKPFKYFRQSVAVKRILLERARKTKG